MRLLKFIGAFLLVAALLFGLVAGLNWKSFEVFLDNRTAFFEGIEYAPKVTSLRGFSEFVAENGEYASLSSVSLDNPSDSIHLRADTPRAMGATANFFTLVAYAYEFEQGIKSPSQSATMEDLQLYRMGSLGQPLYSDAFRTAEGRGYIQDGKISLDHLLMILTEFNETTVADFLWWNVEEETWHWMLDTLNLSYSNLPLPYSGIYLTMASAGKEENMARKIEIRNHTDDEEWWNQIRRISFDYIHSDSFRDSLNTFLRDNRLGITFMEERDGLALFPKITTQKITEILKFLSRDELVSREGSAAIKRWMSWPAKLDQNYINDDFKQFSAIYDNRMGLLSGITVGTSSYTGETLVQALYLDQLPIGFWFHASGGHIHQDFMQRLIYDPAMNEQMRLAITRSTNQSYRANNE